MDGGMLGLCSYSACKQTKVLRPNDKIEDKMS